MTKYLFDLQMTQYESFTWPRRSLTKARWTRIYKLCWTQDLGNGRSIDTWRWVWDGQRKLMSHIDTESWLQWQRLKRKQRQTSGVNNSAFCYFPTYRKRTCGQVHWTGGRGCRGRCRWYFMQYALYLKVRQQPKHTLLCGATAFLSLLLRWTIGRI